MKRKKLILAIFVALFTTGCTVDYNLLIEDNKIKETTTFHQDSSDTDEKSYMYSQYLEEYPIYIDEEYLYYDHNKKVEGNTYYDKSITDDSNGYNATYKAEFKIKAMNNSILSIQSLDIFSDQEHLLVISEENATLYDILEKIKL